MEELWLDAIRNGQGAEALRPTKNSLRLNVWVKMQNCARIAGLTDADYTRLPWALAEREAIQEEFLNFQLFSNNNNRSIPSNKEVLKAKRPAP